MRRIVWLTGENHRRYYRALKRYGAVSSMFSLAFALLDIDPPDLSWLVAEALERAEQAGKSDCTDAGDVGGSHASVHC